MVRITSFLVSIASAEHKESKGVVFKRSEEKCGNPRHSSDFNGIQTPSRSKAIKFDGHCGVLSSPRGTRPQHLFDGRRSIITLYLFRK